MTTLLSQNFQTMSDGVLGAPWTLTGANQLHVVSGAVTLTGTDLNGYATTPLHGQPTQITATFVLFSGSPASTVCLINHNESSFVGANMRLHIVITPTALEVQMRQSNGAFEELLPDGPVSGGGVVASGVYSPASPFVVNTLLGIIVNISGNSVSITAPDGAVLPTITDSRIGSMGGENVAIQTIRAAGTDPLGEWISVSVEGTPDVTSLVPMVVVTASLKDPTGGSGDAGAPAGNGKVTFRIPSGVVDTAGNLLGPQVIERDVTNGEFTQALHLIATDTAGSFPLNWSYSVTVACDNWNQKFSTPLPVAGSPTTLGKLWKTSPDNPNAGS